MKNVKIIVKNSVDVEYSCNVPDDVNVEDLTKGNLHQYDRTASLLWDTLEDQFIVEIDDDHRSMLVGFLLHVSDLTGENILTLISQMDDFSEEAGLTGDDVVDVCRFVAGVQCFGDMPQIIEKFYRQNRERYPYEFDNR